MSKRSQFALAFSPALVLAIAASAAAAPPAGASVEAARLATYETPTGETYFALSLTPKVAVDVSQPRDVVILFDTSASQAGPYRTDALTALNSMLQGLSANDRVMLMAVDMNAVPMTATFTAPGSPEMQAALAKLQQRAPLGATDMETGLRGALATIDGTAPATVVYMGDGMSKAGGFTTESFGALVGDLVKKRVSVSSYAIGQERNIQLLATLANQTGGFVHVDSAAPQSAANAGTVLAGSINSTVVWPEDVSLPQSVAVAYPMPLPPLRSDRDTVLIGQLDSSDPGVISVNASINGKPTTIEWTVTPEKPSEDFAFLPKLVSQAKPEKGLWLPTAGSAGLREAARVTMTSADQLVKLGHEALASGNNQGAIASAEAALQRDPRNPTAIALREAAVARVSAPPAVLPSVNSADPIPAPRVPARGEADLTLVAPAAADAPVAGSLLAEELAESSILPPTIQEELLISQRIQAEVANGLNAARELMGESPEQAEQDLKLLLEQVERVPRLSAEVRRQLRDQIEFSIRESRRLGVEIAESRARQEERIAEANELLRINQDLVVREQRLKQIMDRFNSLMAEGRYEVADQEVIPEIANMAPDTVLAESVVVGGRLNKNVREITAVFARKEKAFVDTLYQVELSQIPFPDEPPIVYPAADVWEDLTIRRKKYASVDLARRGGSEERIFKALNENTQLEFVETPLKDVIAYLADFHEIPIVINAKKLEEAAVGIDTPVTKSLKGISLRSALRLMLAELELTYLIDDEVLQITTPDDANSPDRLTTKVYPVGDLVIPIVNNMNLFGLGGMGGQNGMGGQGGGFGGGMGGGGMGGGGFGGGGMGGGMGGGFFDVQDDLSLGAKQPAQEQPRAAAPQSETKPAKKPAVKAIEIATQSGSPNWDAYFVEQQSAVDSAKDSTAANAAVLASVRETVRQLMAKKQYTEVSSLIQASLRNGFVEPWMYEATGLALQASNASPEELERALLSAVDFAQSEDQVMVIAAYMAKAGLYQRALKLYQQVAASSPTRPQPYIQGLALAQRLDDIKSIQWACVGMLRQSWPQDQQEIGENAYRVAKATYERLISEGRKDEASSFDKAVRQSLQRDCLVRVTWTGEADVDVSVEEPSGTVCTLRNPRTTAGGVLLGDVSSADKGATVEGYSETYVCGEGFDGEYRVLIRNVWGKPTSGKVTVDVFTHYNTDKQKLVSKQIPLGDKNALVLFNLDEGRRAEPLAEAQVAQVAKIQNDVKRAVLAQQLAGLDNSAAALRYAAAMGLLNGTTGSTGGNGAGNGNGNGGGVLPADFFRRGAVGYRPVITALPEGANFSSNAVISADRRYVRVSPSPTFSQVTEVSTFNFVTGSGSTQGGGNGGGGGGIGGGGGGFF